MSHTPGESKPVQDKHNIIAIYYDAITGVTKVIYMNSEVLRLIFIFNRLVR